MSIANINNEIHRDDVDNRAKETMILPYHILIHLAFQHTTYSI